MEIYMDIYSAHLHVRGVLADLCPGNIRIDEATVRLPLSASILIIINDYHSFPTLTPPSVISRRHDSRPKVSYNDGFARTREEWTRMTGMHKLEYLTGSIIETRSVSNQWYAKSAGGNHENIYYCRSPLSIYPLRVIIVPGFVISTGVLTGWNSTLLNFLLFFSFSFSLYFRIFCRVKGVTATGWRDWFAPKNCAVSISEIFFDCRFLEVRGCFIGCKVMRI